MIKLLKYIPSEETAIISDAHRPSSLWHHLQRWMWLPAALLAAPTAAVTYGIYEPRGLAMGGATVAAATPQQAQFYNPALLAFHEERAEDSRAGRLWVPVLSGATSQAAVRIAEETEDDLDSRISNAVAEFNAQPTAANAAAARRFAANLEDLLELLSEETIEAEAFAGLAVAEPDRQGGGAFHLGIRVVAGAQTNLAESDRERLDQYLDTFDHVVAGAQGEMPHPQLFDASGDLIDPIDTIESTVSGRGAAIVEWGVSAARMFEWGDVPLTVGITPKLMEVRVYQKLDQVIDGGVGGFDDAPSDLTGNLDLGAAVDLGNGLRAGLAVKDLVKQDFETADGEAATLHPRVRAGLAYSHSYLTLGVDLDLMENDPIGFEDERQELALGAEIHATNWLDLRLGYRHDLAQSEARALSGGIGLHLGRFLLDIAYSKQEAYEGAAMQLGFAF